MSRTSKHLRKPATLAVLIAIIALGAASAMAALAAGSAAKPFELVLNGAYELGAGASASFTSKAPFCESGSAVDVDFGEARFMCADGSGSITLQFRPESWDPDWKIVEGTGQYAGLRGRGTVQEDWTAYSITFQGFVAEDAVAPTIALASAKASKVKGTKGVYTIPVALDIRDNVEDNPVTYRVIVMRESGTGPWLASTSGEAIGNVSVELRVHRPHAGVRAVLIRTTAVDPVGNEVSLDARVKLPR